MHLKKYRNEFGECFNGYFGWRRSVALKFYLIAEWCPFSPIIYSFIVVNLCVHLDKVMRQIISMQYENVTIYIKSRLTGAVAHQWSMY